MPHLLLRFTLDELRARRMLKSGSRGISRAVARLNVKLVADGFVVAALGRLLGR